MSTPTPTRRVGIRATASIPTIDEIKEVLGIDPSDTSKDDAITAMLATVIAMIESYLGRGIAFAHEIEEFDPPETRVEVLLLFRFPVQSITSVTQEGATLGGYHLRKGSGVVRWREGCARVWRCDCSELAYIVVEYDGGYPDDAWPADLLDAVMRVFYARWHASGDTGNPASTEGVSANRSISVDGLTIEHRDPSQSVYVSGGMLLSMNPEIAPVAAQLEPYRAHRAGGV